MRKGLLALILAMVGVAYGQVTYTPNVGLQIPAGGSTNWNLPLNYNFTLIDQLFAAIAANQSGVNLQIKPNFVAGPPTIPCTTNNEGQESWNTTTTPFTGSICHNLVWSALGSGGGGGGGG